MTTWRQLIEEAMAGHGETWADVIAEAWGDDADSYTDEPCAASADRVFDAGFGRPQGGSFCVWTARHVYFPVCYDGAESAGSAPRDPGGAPVCHVGGW